MHVIHTRNVHCALPEGIRLLTLAGEREESRNGPVLVYPAPVTTCYSRPEERVLFWPERDANPFFSLFESLWMLAGRNDVEYPARFAKNMLSYSDDGLTLNGAYGHRWRRHFGHDQIEEAIRQLKNDPSTRRVVLQMWDAVTDLTKVTKDKPCNTQIYLWVRSGALCMTVCCRSNDMVWGGYGANAVHMSMLQEYVATSLGMGCGPYWQMSNNYHMYLTTYEPLKELGEKAADLYRMPRVSCPYTDNRVARVPMMDIGDPHCAARFMDDVDMFLDEPEALGAKSFFIRSVCKPMLRALSSYKAAPSAASGVLAKALLNDRYDWHVAAREWFDRRITKHATEQ